MKKFIYIIIILLSFTKIFAENLIYEDFIVKQRNSIYTNKTFYLGQVQEKANIDNLLRIYKSENLNTYEGYSNVLKIYNDDIDLYFINDEFYKLIEIKIKSKNFYLYKSNLSVGQLFTKEVSLYSQVRNYQENPSIFYGEMEDITFDVQDEVFMNISITTENNIIQSICLYFTYSL